MEILPEILIVVPEAPVIPEARKLMLLKFCVPEPLMLLDGPLNEIVLVLPVKVPLFTQFPLTEWAKLLPLNVVELSMLTFPLNVIFEAAV